MHDKIADLDELALNCRDKKAGTYLREAIACYQAGAMRAAIISTWIAVAFDFIDKVNTLEAQGDAQAKKFAEEFRKIRHTSDLKGALLFERQILDRAHKDLQLISDLEYADLTRLFEDRHRCAHPSMITDQELYQPTAEQVRYLMRSAVNSMLSQPPTSGKAALSQLEEQVRGEYFPLDKKNARTQLEAGLLRKARAVLVRNFAVVLLKTITSPAETPKIRTQAAAALNALREMHPKDSNAVLAEKLSERLRPPVISDERLGIALGALFRIEDGETYIEDDVRGRLSNFIETIPNEKFVGVAAAAFKVTLTRQAALSRAATLEFEHFAPTLAAAPELIHEKPIRERAIKMYALAGSFYQANAIVQSVIMPMTQSFDRQEIEEIVRLGFENGQIRYSHEFPGLLKAFKMNESVDASWWDPLLNAQNQETFVHDLLYNPPSQEVGEPSLGDSEDIN